MLKHTISRAAFLAVAMTSVPALADNAAVSNNVNDLAQQVQEQQREINQLQSELNEKKRAKRAAAVQQQQQALSAPDQQRPVAVAPLQPTTLGTLHVSELPAGASTSGAVATPSVHVLQAPRMQAAQTVVPATTQPQYIAQINSGPQKQIGVVASASPTGAAVAAPVTNTNSNAGPSPAHVGEAPPSSTKPPEVQALASVGGVLTPYGRMVVEPFLQYSDTSLNTFAFDGVQVIPAFLIGTVAANSTARDLVETGATVRLGVSDRTELEARVPFVYRADSLTNTIPNTNEQLKTNNANGYGLGDIELAAHYQINNGQEDWPFFIANLRYKSDSGSSPYDVKYNTDGTERVLATGSGFMAVEPSVTVIYPSDPATLFANLGYIHSFGYDINHNVAGSFVNSVTPGDTYIASLGMGVALNDKLSFTLGYEHDYVLPTETVVSGVSQNSAALQEGSALTGISYKLNDRTSINLSLAAGVTPDAPSVVAGVRVPIALQAF